MLAGYVLPVYEADKRMVEGVAPGSNVNAPESSTDLVTLQLCESKS